MTETADIPAVPPESASTPDDAATPADPRAPWPARAAALMIDLLPGAVVVATMALVALCFPLYGVWWWICVSIGALAILAGAANRLLLPAATGWSLGRAVTGITVVRGDGAEAAAVGAGRLLLRDLAHLLDTASAFVGWLWPLWDRRGRTFADLLLRTEVHRGSRRAAPSSIRAVAAAVFVTAAALSVAGAATSYFAVYRHDHRSDLTGTEIARQAPKIVERLLSYEPDSLDEDFARAQSVATEKYREQLVPQQEAVRKGKPSPNEYRTVNTAVLSASPNRATALMFLQGERGEPGKERLISATVRVTFAKTAGAWRVDDLAVVTKPVPAGEAK